MALGLNARMERNWDVLTNHAAVWPCGDLDTGRLVEACLCIVRSAHPRSYITRQIARAAAAAGQSPEEFLLHRRDEFVVDVECGSREELIEILYRTPRPANGLPFRCVVADGGMGVSFSHELGDGHGLNEFMRALFTAYRDRPATVAFANRVVTDRELLASLAGTFLRRPSSIAGWMSAALRRARRRRTSHPPEGGRAAGPSRREVIVVSETELAALDAWRRRQDPKPSSTVVLLWIVAKALRDNGFPDPQPWQVMVNLRGPEWSTVGGNLVGRALFDVREGTSAAAITDEIRFQARGADLLAQHVLKMAREVAQPVDRSLRESGTLSRSVGGQPGLSWSDLGRHGEGGYGPLIPTATRDGGHVRPEVVVFVSPYEEGFAVVVNWMNGGALLSLSFGASPIDDRGVDAAVAALRGGVSRLLPTETAARPA